MIIDKFNPLQDEMFQILDERGNVKKGYDSDLDEKTLLDLYRYMVISRMADEKAFSLQREGRIGTYPPLRGQEAMQIGSAMAMEKGDWLFPVYRDMGAMMVRGVPFHLVFLYWMGYEEGNCFPEDANVFPISIPVGSQISLGVGHAWAAKLKNKAHVNLVSFGDGASSETDFHDGLNFAGVFNVPTVFFCSNNQWAISVPRKTQTGAKTIAQKALAYGFNGIQVDGNDILAIYQVTREALGKARGGGGPTLIEAYGYRMGDHTTADDAKRYRSEEEVAKWEKKDPIKRFKTYLTALGILTTEIESDVEKKGEAIIREAVKNAESFVPADPEEIFKYTYEEMPTHLKDQFKEFQESLKS
ncbi:MAG: pyruvate dehydrogenase (acetyl-transferring) E1 component subunit alpha [Nitrospinota bacterium]